MIRFQGRVPNLTVAAFRSGSATTHRAPLGASGRAREAAAVLWAPPGHRTALATTTIPEPLGRGEWRSGGAVTKEEQRSAPLALV